jgi:UDP-N-acetylmuramyl tripeptide synthase
VSCWLVADIVCAEMRRTAAVAAAKFTAEVSRRFRMGGGTALPGLVAERIDPDVVSALSGRLGQGNVLITGTNGKTTTAGLLRSIASAAQMQTVANRAGSNMMRGIAASLAESAGWDGDYEAPDRLLGVFEVDEATLPEAAWSVRPRAVVFTNLFRDQLDRYGEVDYVSSVWRGAVTTWPNVATLVLNADDPSVAALGHHATGRVLYYGIKDRSLAPGEALEHAADARWCVACGSELKYYAVFYGHLGHWRCTRCGRERPRVEVGLVQAAVDGDATQLSISMPGGEFDVSLPLTGLYNAYNAVAAAAGAFALGMNQQAIEHGPGSFTAAFGRQERLEVDGRRVEVMLAKNPAGLNQVLRTITGQTKAPLHLALFLNDGLADGRDISWIWDVDFEMLKEKAAAITVSGTRAWDMALRLKYAGLEQASAVEKDYARALRQAIRQTPEGGLLQVIPTYTAMLEVRETLAGWVGRNPFWEEE